MAVDPETKSEYNSLIAEHRKELSDFDKKLSVLKKRVQKEKKLASLFRVGIISTLIRQTELRLKMNGLSEQMMELKNSNFLDSAKKDLSSIFSNLEAMVTLRTNESFNFNRDMLDQLKPFNPRQRLNMLKHIKSVLKNLIHAYGESTKWKWSFPEMWAKLAAASKNLFDFREYQKTKDPRMEFYYDLQEFLEMVKDLLFLAAGENANKFRLSTKSPADMLVAVRLLEDLRRIASLTGDQELVKKSKAGIDSYRASVEAEEKAKEKAKEKEKEKKRKKKRDEK